MSDSDSVLSKQVEKYGNGYFRATVVLHDGRMGKSSGSNFVHEPGALASAIESARSKPIKG